MYIAQHFIQCRAGLGGLKKCLVNSQIVRCFAYFDYIFYIHCKNTFLWRPGWPADNGTFIDHTVCHAVLEPSVLYSCWEDAIKTGIFNALSLSPFLKIWLPDDLLVFIFSARRRTEIVGSWWIPVVTFLTFASTRKLGLEPLLSVSEAGLLSKIYLPAERLSYLMVLSFLLVKINHGNPVGLVQKTCSLAELQGFAFSPGSPSTFCIMTAHARNISTSFSRDF